MLLQHSKLVQCYRPLCLLKHTKVRYLRILRKPDPQVNVGSQLAVYPPDIRKQVLDEMRHAQTSGKAGEATSEDFSASVISDFLATAQSPDALDKDFWRSVELLARSVTKLRSPNHIDLFAQLFEAAKDIKDSGARFKLMSDIGRYIYRQKRVRFDPVNEIEFLDSLVASGRASQALKIWSSRRINEDHKALWQEVGVLYNLDAGLLHKADRLARAIRQGNPQVLTPRVVVALINAWTRELRKGRSPAEAKSSLGYWTDSSFELKVSPSDLEMIFHALVSSRSWGLSARVAHALPTELVREMEQEGRLVLLADAFSLSIASRRHEEEDFMSLFEALLDKFPTLASHGSVSASLILSFVKQGDLSAGLGLLEDFAGLETKYPNGIARGLAKSFIRHAGTDCDLDLIYKVEQLVGEPNATIEILKHLKQRGKAAEFVKHYVESKRSLTPKLAFEILRMRAFTLLDDNEFLKLGIDANTWRYIWYLSARHIIPQSPRELASTMTGHEISSELLLFMSKSFLNHSESFESGVASLFSTLVHFERATPAQAAMVLGALKKSRPHSIIPLSPSKFRTQIAEEVPEGSKIPWVSVAEQAQKYFGLPNIEPMRN